MQTLPRCTLLQQREFQMQHAHAYCYHRGCVRFLAKLHKVLVFLLCATLALRQVGSDICRNDFMHALLPGHECHTTLSGKIEPR